MLPSLEYSVTVPVSVDAAFRAFQDLHRLLNRGIYREATWVQGAPWEVSSRLRYVLVHPLPATISAVVTEISPPRSVNLLNHALGITADQHVSFGPDLKGGTRIRMTMTLVGKSDELSDTEVEKVALSLARDALDTVVEVFQPSRAQSAPGQ